jgi:oxygen-dependent protoporphyrinogen oxidase
LPFPFSLVTAIVSPRVIIIIGAGITGLSAAYELARRHVPFVVLEAGSRPGGLIHTERTDGFTIDAGAESMLIQKPAALTLCEELGLSARLISTRPPRTAFVAREGRLYPIPSPSVLGIPTTMAGLAKYELLDWRARARIAIEPWIPARGVRDESVASFFRRRFGSATVGLIAEPLLGGIHAGDVEQLSMPALFPRFAAAEQRPGGVLRGMAAPASLDGLFRALRGGMSELVEAMVRQLPAGTLRLETPASAIGRTPAGWTVSAGGETFHAAGVIVAAPAHAAATLLRSVDDNASRICATVPYVSSAIVALGWSRADIAHPLAGSGFVVARRHNPLRITACTWVSSKWEDRAPAGTVLLRAFLGSVHDPQAADLGDSDLVDIARRDLSVVLGIAAPPILARAFRWHNAGAQHNVGHRARMAGLAARLCSLPGLFVAGGGFESIGIPDCVASGRGVATAAHDYVRIGR